jgi:hypothetical protein
MEQECSSETDPPEIRRRLESIQRQRALIEDLATRLKAAQLEYDRMETELNEYRCSIAPIRKCPEEVLLMIFESFAAAAPELAGLLQVCKRWRDIAANAPRLWTHINIKVKPSWDQRKAARRDTAMIKKHLKHSASLPLHINVDLNDMLNEEDQMEGFLGALSLNGCNNKICRDARKFVSDLDVDESEDPVPCFSRSYGPKHVLTTINTLIGTDGIHMSRWKSFHIFLPPNGRDITEIWRLFSGPTPQLTQLLISGDGLPQVSGTNAPVSFPDLSSLELLTLHSVVKKIDFLGLTFSSVKRLELDMYTPQISLFTSLEHLDLCLSNAASTADAVKVIRLPLLRDLTFYSNASTTIEWHVPLLQRLEIVGPFHSLVAPFPDVQALEVTWRPSYDANNETILQRSLQTMMSQYKDMQKLTMHALLRPIWENYVQQLGEEKRLDLPTIAFD